MFLLRSTLGWFPLSMIFFFLHLIKTRIVSPRVACFLFLLSQCPLQYLERAESLLKPGKPLPVKNS